MSNQDRINETPESASPRGRVQPNRASMAAAIVGAALLGAFASSSLGQRVGQRMLANVPGIAAAATLEGGFGLSHDGVFAAADGQGGLLGGAIETMVETRADRMIRHLSIEIDATGEQQDKLREIVRTAVRDILPVREKVLAARATARELLTQQTVDRGAIEKLRADQIAIHDAASKRLVQAVADAAEVLTPEQRRKLNAMLAPRGGHWGHGAWRNWGGFGRN